MSDNNTKPKNYLNNRDLYDELIKCQQTGRMSEHLGKMFVLLSEKYSTHRYFNQYSFKDDLISTGTLACCNAFMKFDPNKSSNPFAFFSSVVYHSFLQTIKKEYKQKDIKDSVLVENELNPSYGYEDRLKEQEDKIKQEKERNDQIEHQEQQDHLDS